MSKREPQEPIMEWLYAGPFEIDVSDLYESNYQVPIEPYEHFLASGISEAVQIRKAKEGESFQWFNQTKPWTYLRTNPADKKVTWARFGTHARLLQTFAYQELYIENASDVRCHLQITGSAALIINGKVEFHLNKFGTASAEHDFTIRLEAGWNSCILVLTNVHVHSINSFALSYDVPDLVVRLPLVEMTTEERAAVEAQFDDFYLLHTLLDDNHKGVELCFDRFIQLEGGYEADVYKGDQRLTRIKVEGSGPVTILLLPGSSLNEADDYTVRLRYVSRLGQAVEGPSLPFQKISHWDFTEEIKASFKLRTSALLNRYVSLPAPTLTQRGIGVSGIYYELAKLEAGHSADTLRYEIIENTLDYIESRYDCADFALHGVLRLFYKYRSHLSLPEGLWERVKTIILGFKYGEDEPGKSMMFCRSENHQILFFSAEYLAGRLFPNEIFMASGQNGVFHAFRGRLKTERWIKEKGTYGFTEWHSNIYYEEDLIALLNLHDFSETGGYLRHLTKQLLDFTCFLIATHQSRGVMGTTHGRSYENMMLHPELEGMSHLNWLLFGQPERIVSRLSMGAVILCGSGYKILPDHEKLAQSVKPIYTLSRMGMFPHHGLGGVNCATYRTKDYMVSGMVESKKGTKGDLVQAGQILLDGQLPIFVTCFDNNSETTRPSYWGGQYVIPKMITYKNTMAYIYEIPTVAGFTHCYFPFSMFDEIVQQGKWLFGRKNNAYIGLHSTNTMIRTQSGKWKDKELLCLNKSNTWLFEAGSREEWGSFSKFVEAISSAELKQDDEVLLFHSPTNGRFELSWNQTCLRGGKAMLVKDYPLILNDYAYGEYGSGIIEMKLEDKQGVLNFNM
ncbi:hypothetical protein SAMN03159341_107241 [Paenibacillus sp. 1_12]|uniref:hypothetical protein n=1 Tax=Paenibacillus sp. 1_12 TaxID=1566278 RepID=UPI0008DED6E8|nr:hypothetical protein [Paenibacillus sp. 1_12]SFL58455.1 hypothetical protein SAMN03159341_107241 [Paenibacillus sp. 1_12]